MTRWMFAALAILAAPSAAPAATFVTWSGGVLVPTESYIGGVGTTARLDPTPLYNVALSGTLSRHLELGAAVSYAPAFDARVSGGRDFQGSYPGYTTQGPHAWRELAFVRVRKAHLGGESAVVLGGGVVRYSGVHHGACLFDVASPCQADNEVGRHRTRLLLHAGLEHVGLFGASWLGVAVQDDADRDAALGLVHNLSAAAFVRLRVPPLGPPLRKVNSQEAEAASGTP